MELRAIWKQADFHPQASLNLSLNLILPPSPNLILPLSLNGGFSSASTFAPARNGLKSD